MIGCQSLFPTEVAGMTSEVSRPADADDDGPAAAVEKADIKVGQAMASRRKHPVVDWCCGVGEVGDQGPLYLMGASMVAVGLFRKNPHAVVAGISFLAAVGVADVTKSTVKKLVKRSRPEHSLEEGNYRFEAGGSEERKEQSFPSGHVAGAVAAAGVVSRFYPSAAPYVRTSAVVIGLSRILKGSHWPLDLAAGGLIGWVSERLVRGVIPRIFLPFLSRKTRRHFQ